ncbi:tetratricopeptide repeat protein [Planktothrix sp. PCC 11201]|uniref:tetratricopeptide repeat protein n=1 Tax=Planktothrix sp. PCC 11201 TaxID=1729650 RepID=UPI0009A8FC9E|nr:tetratricopeptide repeat protein [Planktothrix sp. PCC 11201]
MQTVNIILIAVIVILSSLGNTRVAIAQKPKQPEPEKPLLDDFSPNPLFSKESDPLLPSPPPDGQVLGQSQQQILEPELVKLNAEATGLLVAGNIPGAFELWNRELRIRRYFGLSQEIAALNRVGLIAWNNSQRLYIKFITERLDQISQKLNKEKINDLQLWESLGLAFKNIRAKNSALSLYQQLLETANQSQDSLAQEQYFNEIAQIYMMWLDYPNAAQTYEKLLELQQEIRAIKGDVLPPPTQPATPENPNPTPPPSEVRSLQQLAFIYEQTGEYLKAISVKERLAGYYANQQNLLPIPEIKLGIGWNYEKLEQFEQAGLTYQEAYSIATSIQQFDNASEALGRLGKLYRSQNQIKTALDIYQAQVLVNQQAYNYYGMMNAYDQIGDIYLSQKAYQSAIAAFQQGLGLAQQLKYREDYFVKKIDLATRQMNR